MTFRHGLLLFHRWSGIVLAAFVVTAGITGSLLAFHHEIDAALAPELHRVQPGTQRASLDDIASRIEARHPGLVVGYFLPSPEDTGALVAVMNTRAAAQSGKLDRDAARPTHVFADPWSGRILGERTWGELGTGARHVVPLVYRFHTTLFAGEAGKWITGGIAAAWIAMLAIGLVLALPSMTALRHVFRLRWAQGGARRWFDLHRVVGLAAAIVLVVSAFSGLYMNLPQVVEPAVAALSPFTQRPASVRPQDAPRETVWRVGWDAAHAAARAQQPEHPLVVLGRVEARGYYQARFMPPDDIMDAGTIRLFVDGRDGGVLGRFEDRKGSFGDLVRIWQFPLHSGQGFGLPGRILVCVAGLAPLLLALSGFALWLRRRRRRREWTPSGAPSRTGIPRGTPTS
jgi:uncharacterized iron-regulated membrane protein